MKGKKKKKTGKEQNGNIEGKKTVTSRHCFCMIHPFQQINLYFSRTWASMPYTFPIYIGIVLYPYNEVTGGSLWTQNTPTWLTCQDMLHLISRSIGSYTVHAENEKQSTNDFFSSAQTPKVPIKRLETDFFQVKRPVSHFPHYKKLLAYL